MIKRVLMTTKNKGKGTQDSPIRNVMEFYDEESLTPIGEIDPLGDSIDFSIDVRYETDVIEAFNKFIKKWCGSNYPHLIDTDEQDGQFMRDKIQELIDSTKK